MRLFSIVVLMLAGLVSCIETDPFVGVYSEEIDGIPKLKIVKYEEAYMVKAFNKESNTWEGNRILDPVDKYRLTWLDGNKMELVENAVEFTHEKKVMFVILKVKKQEGTYDGEYVVCMMDPLFGGLDKMDYLYKIK